MPCASRKIYIYITCGENTNLPIFSTLRKQLHAVFLLGSVVSAVLLRASVVRRHNHETCRDCDLFHEILRHNLWCRLELARSDRNNYFTNFNILKLHAAYNSVITLYNWIKRNYFLNIIWIYEKLFGELTWQSIIFFQIKHVRQRCQCAEG